MIRSRKVPHSGSRKGERIDEPEPYQRGRHGANRHPTGNSIVRSGIELESTA